MNNLFASLPIKMWIPNIYMYITIYICMYMYYTICLWLRDGFLCPDLVYSTNKTHNNHILSNWNIVKSHFIDIQIHIEQTILISNLTVSISIKGPISSNRIKSLNRKTCSMPASYLSHWMKFRSNKSTLLTFSTTCMTACLNKGI